MRIGADPAGGRPAGVAVALAAVLAGAAPGPEERRRPASEPATDDPLQAGHDRDAGLGGHDRPTGTTRGTQLATSSGGRMPVSFGSGHHVCPRR